MQVYLYGLGDVHLVDLNMREASSWHLLKVLFITIKQVGRIDAHTYGSLNAGWRVVKIVTKNIFFK